MEHRFHSSNPLKGTPYLKEIRPPNILPLNYYQQKKGHRPSPKRLPSSYLPQHDSSTVASCHCLQSIQFRATKCNSYHPSSVYSTVISASKLLDRFFQGQYRRLSVKVVEQLGFLAVLTIIGPKAFQV